VIDVIQVGGFHDRVHAAQWQRNQGAGDALAGMEDLVGVCAGGAAAGFVLDRGFCGFGDLFQALDDEGVVRCAVGESGARAEFDFAMLGGIKARGVGGVGDVEANAHGGLEAVCGHHGTVSANFFLHGIETDEREGRFALAGGDAFHHLGDDVAADTIIECATDNPPVSEFDWAVLIDGGVAHTDAEFCDF